MYCHAFDVKIRNETRENKNKNKERKKDGVRQKTLKTEVEGK